ncbi:MAG: hypothetical protein HC802_01665, partial [Caldilineaceae bacterium]|nr:hypothetical protein [Caldilineaceae bacterium]
MTEFRGLFPAIITPMTSDGALNEEAFRKVMEWNIQAGVHGFWVAGGTGESVLLDDDENRRIAEITVDQSAGRVRNIMHVGQALEGLNRHAGTHAAGIVIGNRDLWEQVPCFRADGKIVTQY